MKKIRYKLWFWLICLADRISPENAFRRTGLQLRYVLHEGTVVDFEGPGQWLWVQDCDRHLAFNGDEYYEK